MNELQTPQKFAVRFGRSKNVVAVSSFAEASKAWERLRDEQGLGASDSPKVSVVNIETGKEVATISYNGRVWQSGVRGRIEIPLEGRKTAAQHQAEGWTEF